MGPILAFIFSRGGAITAAVLFLAAIFGVQAFRLSHAKSDLTKATASLQQAVDGEKRCVAAIAAQNGQIKALSDQSTQVRAQAAAGVAKAQAQMTKLLAARATLKTFTPTGETVCLKWSDADRAVAGALK